MNDQLLKYLDRTDRENVRLATLVYSINLAVNLLALGACLKVHIGPGFIMRMDDIHAVTSVMYFIINLMLLYEIRRHKDERKRMYLLPTYSLLIGLDLIAEEIIVIVMNQGAVLKHLLGRPNVLFAVTATFTMAIYLNRYISLMRKYTMLPMGRT